MSKRQKHLYEFGHFTLDALNRLLSRDGRPVPLQPKALDTLLLLVERWDEVLTKDELLQQLWPDSFVEEADLSQNIYVLRKALGQAEGGDELIRTVPKRGYRFVADVRELRDLEDADLIVEEQTRIVPAGAVARIYMALGDRDYAFELLGQAAERHDQLMLNLKVDPTFDPLRSDPRFKELQVRVGLTQ